ncbi:MAG TPA: hypothetical protein HA230_03820 [Candidatus Aenigmarchaeota archaeon]|nr:hypothetical protein [Candidatus Aenigmarchaeota archaeon]
MTGVGIARMVVFRQMNDAYQSLQEIDPDNDHLRLAMPDERADISVIYEYAKSLRKEIAGRAQYSFPVRFRRPDTSIEMTAAEVPSMLKEHGLVGALYCDDGTWVIRSNSPLTRSANRYLRKVGLALP